MNTAYIYSCLASIWSVLFPVNLRIPISNYVPQIFKDYKQSSRLISLRDSLKAVVLDPCMINSDKLDSSDFTELKYKTTNK